MIYLPVFNKHTSPPTMPKRRGPWRHIADRLQQPAVVKPVDPFQRRILHIINVTPGTAATNDFCLVEAFIVSARALSYESPTLPTEDSMPASASRSV